ncbi:MAG: hypothetical protein WC246_00615 [Candidatus Paceibacterota bacterium]|jgi:hypothetical protein
MSLPRPQKIIQAVIGSFFGILFFACALGILTPSYASAATLSVATSRTTYGIGDTIVARIYVGSSGEATNAVEGTLVVPSMVDFSSVAIDGSIISFWIQKPSYAGTGRSVYFSGVVTNPGFTGDRGLVLTVYARAQSAGSGSFSIRDGSVLANDGQGTQILTSVANAQVAVRAQEIIAPEPPVPSGAPVISSVTHPDQTKWYAKSPVVFAWPKNSLVTAVRLVYDQNKATLPAVSYDPPIWTKNIDASDDGTWYFRVQEQTKDGWGAVGMHRVNIDTAPPHNFAVLVQGESPSDDPHPTISFGTADDLSGVDHYTITVDGQIIDTVAANPSKNMATYQLPPQAPGQKTITVEAFDAAGNSTRATTQLTVVPIPAPVIDSYPLQSVAGDPIIIAGHATSGESIVLSLKGENGEAFVASASTTVDGNFALVWPTKVSDGLYVLTAHAVDARGAQSNPTAPVSLVINQQAWMRIAMSWLTYGSLGAFIIFFLIGTAFVALLMVRRLRRLQKEIGIGKHKTEETLHQALIRLAAHVRNHVDILEKTTSKRRLSEEESALLTELRDDVADVEKKIEGTLDSLDHQEKR